MIPDQHVVPPHKRYQTVHLSTLNIFLFFEKGDTANQQNLYKVSCIQKVK